MKKIKTLLLAPLLIMAGALAQSATPYPSQFLREPWQQTAVAVPTSSTAVTIIDSVIDRVSLNFLGAGTCTITDAAGNLLVTVTTSAAAWIPSNDLGGIYFAGGVKWSCTISNVIGWMRGRYKGQ